MKTPKDLPWKLTPTFDLAIVDSNYERNEAIALHLWKKDAIYIIEACNNFPEAISILELCLERLEMNNIEKSEQEFIDKVESFLEQFKED